MDETVFTYGSPQLKFGPGAIDEIAWDASNLGARSVAVVSDPGVADAGITQRVADVLTGGDISVDTFTGARVEPSDASLQEATDWARKNGPWDAIVAVGGGSSIDTAKAIALMLDQPTLIKRPVLDLDGHILVGFKPELYEKTIR